MHQSQPFALGAGLATPEVAASAIGLDALGAVGASPADLEPLFEDFRPRLPDAEELRVDGQRKAIATLVARAALAGYQLLELADGSFMASRWTLLRPLASVEAVEDFLRRVGAPE